MGKIINTYRAYTSSEMKTRSTIPTATDIATAAGYIDCVNIKASVAHDTVGATSYNLSQICTATGVNHWSAFGPTIRTATGTGNSAVLVNQDPTTAYSLGSFAGYNHSAVAPSWDSGANEEWWIQSTAGVTADCRINIGELTYTDLTGGVGSGVAVCFALYDPSGNTMTGDGQPKLVQFSATNFKNLAYFDSTATTGYYGGWIIIPSGVSGTFTGKAFIMKESTWEPDGSHTLCKVPGLTDWTIKIHTLTGNFVYLDAPAYYVAGVSSGWELSLPNFYATGASAGYFDAYYLAYRNADGSAATTTAGLKVYVEAWEGSTGGGTPGPKVTYDHVLYSQGSTTGWSPVNAHNVWMTGEDTGQLSLTARIVTGASSCEPLNTGYGYRCHVAIF